MSTSNINPIHPIVNRLKKQKRCTKVVNTYYYVKPPYKSHKLMGIIWANTGSIGCTVLISQPIHLAYLLQCISQGRAGTLGLDRRTGSGNPRGTRSCTGPHSSSSHAWCRSPSSSVHTCQTPVLRQLQIEVIIIRVSLILITT